MMIEKVILPLCVDFTRENKKMYNLTFIFHGVLQSIF